MKSKGAARLLAEPNLVTLSGETASFLAGGQIPIPEVGATGTPSFGFQPYGVGLSFTPTVLRNGVINLIVKPEVSEIDHANAVTVAGTTVPALTTRKASTTLELRDGQSFMLGGLLQSDGTNNIDQLPWVGDVPVLGALFRTHRLSEERDRSRHPGDAAHRAAADADRPGAHAARQLACRRTTSICS